MKRGVKAYTYLVTAFLLVSLGGYLYKHRFPIRTSAKPLTRPQEAPRPGGVAPSLTKKAPQVALVIDDVAYNTTQMDHFASLGIPLTFAILPRHKLAKTLSDLAHRYRFAVMLHLPMEPIDVAHNDPGPSGLYLNMSDQELKSQFDRDVNSVPAIAGINNHMGSAFTEDEEKMKLVLGWVKQRGLFFLDSYTTTRSKVLKAAKAVGIPCLRNETFLDNEDTVEGIEKQLDLVMNLALKRHRTIAIGHYRRKFIIQALQNKIPEFKAQGIEFVTLPVFYQK